MNLQKYKYSMFDDQNAPQSPEYFKTSIEHVFSELKRVDVLIQMAVEKARLIYHSNDQFRGLYISDDEIDQCLTEPIGIPRWRYNNYSESNVSEMALYEDIKSNNNAITEQSKIRNIELRLDRLKEKFQLPDFDVDVILICLLAEVDLSYEKIYAYLQDDISKKQPEINLIFNLLCVSTKEVISYRNRFSQNAPLIKHRLINLESTPDKTDCSFLTKNLRLDSYITSFLLDFDGVDERLSDCVHVAIASEADDIGLNQKNIISQYDNILKENINKKSSIHFYLQGEDESEKQNFAKHLSSSNNKSLLIVNCENLLHENEIEFLDAIERIIRESVLQDSFLYLSNYSLFQLKDNIYRLDLIMSKLSLTNQVVFLSSNKEWESSVTDCLVVKVEFTIPNYNHRIELWNKALSKHEGIVTETEINEIAAKFFLTGEQITKAVNMAKEHVFWSQSSKCKKISSDELYKACRQVSSSKLVSLAQKLEPKFSLADISLPLDQTKQLLELINTIKYKSCVYERWGFEKKFSLGKGINILFSGQSGTGKTMAAEIIANELGLDIYKINISSVFSKYIGETEKHLSKIFDDAKASNAILFFDEADSVFGKRTSVSSSNDRYANLETNFLLQKIEEYEGVVILATNLEKNIDSAFIRRINLTISFPLPDENQRKQIWQKIWPEETPLAGDIDLDFVSENFKFTGGDIKNVALAAAFLAIENDLVIENKHLIWATKRELQKMGKVCVEATFGPYSHYAKELVNREHRNDT